MKDNRYWNEEKKIDKNTFCSQTTKKPFLFLNYFSVFRATGKRANDWQVPQLRPWGFQERDFLEGHDEKRSGRQALLHAGQLCQPYGKKNKTRLEMEWLFCRSFLPTCNLLLLGSSQLADTKIERNGGFTESRKIPQIKTSRRTDKSLRGKV